MSGEVACLGFFLLAAGGLCVEKGFSDFLNFGGRKKEKKVISSRQQKTSKRILRRDLAK
jgi:hypothetical protein